MDKEIPVGFLSHGSRRSGNIREKGNIKGFISRQETTEGKYQTAHWYTETTGMCVGPQGRPIPMYVSCRYTHVHTCINTCSNISKPHMDVQHGISLFLTNLLIHSLYFLNKQINKQTNQTGKHIVSSWVYFIISQIESVEALYAQTFRSKTLLFSSSCVRLSLSGTWLVGHVTGFGFPPKEVCALTQRRLESHHLKQEREWESGRGMIEEGRRCCLSCTARARWPTIVREVRGVGGWVPRSLDNSVLGSWNQRPGLRPAKLVVLLVLLLTCSSDHLDGDRMVHRETRGLPWGARGDLVSQASVVVHEKLAITFNREFPWPPCFEELLVVLVRLRGRKNFTVRRFR